MVNETIRQGLQGARLMEDYWNDRITASELVAAIQPQYRRGLEGALQVQAWEAAANDSQKYSGLNCRILILFDLDSLIRFIFIKPPLSVS